MSDKVSHHQWRSAKSISFLYIFWKRMMVQKRFNSSFSRPISVLHVNTVKCCLGGQSKPFSEIESMDLQNTFLFLAAPRVSERKRGRRMEKEEQRMLGSWGGDGRLEETTEINAWEEGGDDRRVERGTNMWIRSGWNFKYACIKYMQIGWCILKLHHLSLLRCSGNEQSTKESVLLENRLVPVSFSCYQWVVL